jgi:2,5-diketo-D-gluconate reductase B
MYQNEAEVGAALNGSGVSRDALLITTKVHPERYSEAEFLGSVEQSVAALGSVPDVLLLHWPPANGAIEAPVEMLADAHSRGLAKHIGVSNFTIEMLERAVKITDIPIVTNQVEFHPLLNQDKLLAASGALGIPLSSYCSVARGQIFKHPEFGKIGETHGKSAAQVALRWIMQKGVSINTMSTKRANIEANFNIVDFELSDEDMARIDALTQTGYRIVTKDIVPYAPNWD